MKHGLLRIFLPLLLAAALTAALAACRDDDGGADGGARATLTVWLSLPEPEGTGAAQAQHRLGDPGEAVPEDDVWDDLTLLLVYDDGRKWVIPLDSQAYNALPPVTEGSKVRRLQLDVPEGKAYLYGATGNQGEDGNPAEALAGADTKDAVEALTISNEYAKDKTDAVARKVSVATGFYHTAEDPDTPALLELTAQVDGQPGDAVPTLTLTRLATKIDVQWDAADAVLEGVTDVRVTDFSLDGGHGITGTGSGRLFPTLNTASDPLMGSAEFTNTSAVSQRNGRVYHYVFSDGVSAPSITFRITAQESGAAEDDHDYTLEFGQPLSPARGIR